MATWDDVERIALALPEVEERPAYGRRAWRVGGRLFVWDRPLRKLELIEGLPARTQPGEILAARVADLEVKEALVESEPQVYFTTAHFDGVPTVLVRLEQISAAALGQLIEEAWLSRAPQQLASGYLERRR